MAPDITRRELLEGFGAAAATAGLVACSPSADTAGSIDHLVLVMMENRTFDHYLGSLALDEGRTEVNGLTADMSNPDPRGGADIRVYHTTQMSIPDPPHAWDAAHAQWDGGAMDGFTTEFYQDHHQHVDPSLVMGYHNRDDLPITYALSDNYTTCQRWHASLMCGTFPNRLYALAGQSGGVKNNSIPLGTGVGYDFRHIFDQLDDAGISWGSYSQSVSSLWLFQNLRGRPQMKTFDHFAAACSEGALPAVSWVEPAFGVHDDHPPTSPLYGQVFLSTIYQALAQSPLWNRSMLIIYYDEHGGFYDHVSPPTTQDDLADQGFDQLGFRIPALAIGPYVRPGYVSDVQFEHTSVLAWLEGKYGLPALTTRVAAAMDLAPLIDQKRLKKDRPYPPAQIAPLDLTDAQIAAGQRMARRQTGHGKALLEARLGGAPTPPHLERRMDLEAVFLETIDLAQKLGAIRIVG